MTKIKFGILFIDASGPFHNFTTVFGRSYYGTLDTYIFVVKGIKKGRNDEEMILFQFNFEAERLEMS